MALTKKASRTPSKSRTPRKLSSKSKKTLTNKESSQSIIIQLSKIPSEKAIFLVQNMPKFSLEKVNGLMSKHKNILSKISYNGKSIYSIMKENPLLVEMAVNYVVNLQTIRKVQGGAAFSRSPSPNNTNKRVQPKTNNPAGRAIEDFGSWLEKPEAKRGLSGLTIILLIASIVLVFVGIGLKSLVLPFEALNKMDNTKFIVLVISLLFGIMGYFFYDLQKTQHRERHSLEVRKLEAFENSNLEISVKGNGVALGMMGQSMPGAMNYQYQQPTYMNGPIPNQYRQPSQASNYPYRQRQNSYPLPYQSRQAIGY
jgi:hypothetical protein